MNVLVVEPGYLPYEKEINSLSEMQQTVGGYIQAIYPYEEPVAIVCNEEGLIDGLPFNRSVPGGYDGVCGTFFICGLGEESFDSIPPALVDRFKQEFKNAEILLSVKDGGYLTLPVPAKPKSKEPKTHEKNHSSPER